MERKRLPRRNTGSRRQDVEKVEASPAMEISIGVELLVLTDDEALQPHFMKHHLLHLS
jgi:hypothetical protein